MIALLVKDTLTLQSNLSLKMATATATTLTEQFIINNDILNLAFSLLLDRLNNTWTLQSN